MSYRFRFSTAIIQESCIIKQIHLVSSIARCDIITIGRYIHWKHLSAATEFPIWGAIVTFKEVNLTSIISCSYIVTILWDCHIVDWIFWSVVQRFRTVFIVYS